MKLLHDVIVIGAGAAGISAALYLKRAGYNPLIIEKDSPGGTLNKIYKIENYPGYVESDGATLAFRMYSQIKRLGIDFKLGKVKEIKKENDIYSITTKDTLYKTKYLIIASGKIPRKLNVKNIEKYEERGISYCALCDGMLYKNKDVAVIGGGNSAMQAIKYLSNIVNKIYVVNRSSVLRADKKEKDEVCNLNNVEILLNQEIKEIIGDDNNINKILLNDKKELDVNGIFVFIGQDKNSCFYESLNIKQDNKGILVDSNMMTNINNVYAIGDAISKKLYQVVSAVSDGAIAANSIIEKIRKNND